MSAQKAYIYQAQRAEQNVSTATTRSQALGAAITAAENYMRALKLSGHTKEKQKLDAKCNELLTTAEQIKAAKDWRSIVHHSGGGGRGVSRAPSSTRQITTREEIILLEGSKLNGSIFLPWVNPPSSEEFQLERGGDLYTDKPDLHLSKSQKEIFDGWKRPSELLASTIKGKELSTVPVVSVSGKIDLAQDMLTDCSVVASLCATTSRTECLPDKELLPQTWPCDKDSGKAQLSPTGKYIFNFYFNGCFRKVIIDDRLPSSNSPGSLHMIDRNNRNHVWPALVEKAYLKVRGGYDFPGSNSGTDLWVLTGWIPEQVFLHSDDMTSEKLWQRIRESFHAGNVFVTIGTGKLTEKEQAALRLVSEHDYAILDLKETEGRGQLLIKNPWSTSDADVQDPDGHAGRERGIIPGCFWMDWDRMLQNFENLYLNWNPAVFKFRENIHFTWDLTTGRGVPGSFVKNPQFSIRCDMGGTVWLLLEKHFRNKSSETDTALKCAEPDFISIYVFKARGERVCLSDGALHRGPYVDSPNTLARLELPRQTTFTAVISEQSLPSVCQNFTLSAFSTSPVIVGPAVEKFAFVNITQGAWTIATAGGNAESTRYSINPQFSLQIPGSADVAILLEMEEPDVAIHVKLFRSAGKRVTRVRNRDIITDSGDYRRGCALAETKDLPPGIYTIVCSTFAPDQLGQFSVRVFATESCTVKPIAAESAGRRITLSNLAILPPGKDRVLAPLHVPRLTRLKLIARSKHSVIGERTVAPSPTLMTVELGQGPYKRVLASSEDGTHHDTASGIRIEDLDVPSEIEQSGGGLWIVLERVAGPGGQVEDRIEVEALAEERVDIGEWVLQDT